MNATYHHTQKVQALVKTMTLGLSVQKLEEFINSSAIGTALVNTVKVLEIVVNNLNSYTVYLCFLIKNRIIHTRPEVH